MHQASTEQDGNSLPASGQHSSHLSGVRLNAFTVLKKHRAPDVCECTATLAHACSSPAGALRAQISSSSLWLVREQRRKQEVCRKPRKGTLCTGGMQHLSASRVAERLQCYIWVRMQAVLAAGTACA